jgi:hypothetical protein
VVKEPPTLSSLGSDAYTVLTDPLSPLYALLTLLVIIFTYALAIFGCHTAVDLDPAASD